MFVLAVRCCLLSLPVKEQSSGPGRNVNGAEDELKKAELDNDSRLVRDAKRITGHQSHVTFFIYKQFYGS